MKLADKIKKLAKGVKVVDKIDLDNIPSSSRPDAYGSKEEKKAEQERQRQMSQLRNKIHNTELAIKDLMEQYDEDTLCQWAKERAQLNLRLEYLRKRMEVRCKYDDVTLDNMTRQKTLTFQGIRPESMDVVHFHVPKMGQNDEEMDGVALVRNENRYYIAVDMYDRPEQEDNISTCMEENEDGTFEGIWPKYVILKKASKFEDRFVRQLVDKYADDIEKAKAYLNSADERDLAEMNDIKARIAELTPLIDEKGKIDEQIAEHRNKLKSLQGNLDKLENAPHQLRNKLQEALDSSLVEIEGITPEKIAAVDAFNDEMEEYFDQKRKEIEAMPDDAPETEVPLAPPTVSLDDFDIPEVQLNTEELTPTENRYPHLPYVRGKRMMTDMSYPLIATDYQPWLRFRLMSNVARVTEQIMHTKPLTYVLSAEYMEELSHRAKGVYRGMLPQDVVADGEATCGVLVYPHQGYEDTVIYQINNRQQLHIVLMYIREGELLFYESFSEVQIVSKPRVDIYIASSLRASGVDPQRLFNFIKNIVVSFLAMEHDNDRTMMHMVADGKGTKEERELTEGDSLNLADDEDVVIRDANWYTSISLDHLIPVQGYVSHRWCGTGKNKVLKQVWVRPHERNGYHREAGVTKS